MELTGVNKTIHLSITILFGKKYSICAKEQKITKIVQNEVYKQVIFIS